MTNVTFTDLIRSPLAQTSYGELETRRMQGKLMVELAAAYLERDVRITESVKDVTEEIYIKRINRL